MADTPIPPKKGVSTTVKVLLGCGILVVLAVICVVVMSALGVAGINSVATQVNNSVTEAANKENTAFNTPHKIGDVVTVKDVQWTITEAKDLGSTLKSTYGSYGTDCKANSGKFVQITVKIKNNGKDMASVMNLNLYDSEKHEYVSSSEVFSCVTGDLYILSNVNPGIEKTFKAIYEVPTTATGLRVKVGDLDLFTDDHQYVSLGL
jgi:hypothetical protein